MENMKRSNLHHRLVEIVSPANVYFQPPENVKLIYPCLIYSRRTGDANYADDRVYRYVQSYDLTYISRNPDDGMVEKLMNSLMGIRYDRHYTSENLHHDTFYLADYK